MLKNAQGLFSSGVHSIFLSLGQWHSIPEAKQRDADDVVAAAQTVAARVQGEDALRNRT